MAWIQSLVETYDACLEADQFKNNPIPPVSHTPQQAHIEITIDGQGNFQSANIVEKEETLVPATTESAGRTGSKPPPHPLCDKVQYVAADYQARGGKKVPFHKEYIELLTGWCSSPFAHPKASAVLKYVQKGTVVDDLINANTLIAIDGKLVTDWSHLEEKPPIFKFLAAAKGEHDQGGAFVRWKVDVPGELEPAVWRDKSLQESWANYHASTMSNNGFCMATGTSDITLATSHPKRLRHAADGAKLISSNDDAGFTFRGRFTDKSGDQACGIGFIASQKAHIALRWLIGKRSTRYDEQALVAWEIHGHDVPDPMRSTFDLFGFSEDAPAPQYTGDAGQEYSNSVNKLVAGYKAHLSKNAKVVIMAIDSASPGRMSIVFYREFGGDEFLERILDWHTKVAWPLRLGGARNFVGAPSPRDIAQAAYSADADDKLVRATIERLLPCIIDGSPIPRDLVNSVVTRATRRSGLEHWDWEKALSIACALYKGLHPEGDYHMALDEQKNSRDYLYGRLLSVADRMEEHALRLAKENNRETMASRLMQRFADHPFSTWRTIELALPPYRSRIKGRTPGLLKWFDGKIDEICDLFKDGEFELNTKLSGEFLLGFHCQRADFFKKVPKTDGQISEGEEDTNDSTAE